MIACQRCGITEDAGKVRILPYTSEDPESRCDWLALCRPCLEREVMRRHQENACWPDFTALATPAWEETRPPTSWHRQILEEKP